MRPFFARLLFFVTTLVATTSAEADTYWRFPSGSIAVDIQHLSFDHYAALAVKFGATRDQIDLWYKLNPTGNPFEDKRKSEQRFENLQAIASAAFDGATTDNTYLYYDFVPSQFFDLDVEQLRVKACLGGKTLYFIRKVTNHGMLWDTFAGTEMQIPGSEGKILRGTTCGGASLSDETSHQSPSFGYAAFLELSFNNEQQAEDIYTRTNAFSDIEVSGVCKLGRFYPAGYGGAPLFQCMHSNVAFRQKSNGEVLFSREVRGSAGDKVFSFD